MGFCDGGDLITWAFENTILIDGPDEIFRHLEPVDHLVGPFADPGIGRETPLACTPAASLANDNVSWAQAAREVTILTQSCFSGRESMLICLNDILVRIPDGWKLQPLSLEAELLGWDAEAHRKRMATQS